MTTPKRKYVRLPPSAWSEISALWEIGDATLPELAERYSVSIRALQAHFAKHKVVKGAKAAEMAAAVITEVFRGETSNQETITRRAKDSRDAAYNNATIIEGLVMSQLALAQKDPTQAYKASAVKTLSLAAATLERTLAVKWRALGLDREDAPPDEFPVLEIRYLSDDEVKAIRESQETEEESELDIPLVPAASDSSQTGIEVGDSDDIIIEGDEVVIEGGGVAIEGGGVVVEGEVVIVGSDERDELAKPRSKALDIHGGRLVKEARP